MKKNSTNSPINLPPRRAALRYLSRTGLSVLGAALAGDAAWAQPHSLQARPRRIVSVSGSLTEIFYALGAESQLVGTDTTSLFPAPAQQTAKVGYMRQLSAEGLLSLRPDAVIGTTEAGPTVVMDQIRSAGVKVELIESDHTWAEVQRKVAAVGRVAGQQAQSNALLEQLDSQWQDARQSVARQAGRKPRALFILAHGAGPQVAGNKTAAHAMLNFAGLVNPLADSFQGYRPMTAESLVSSAPDVIVTSTQGIEASGGADKFWSRPGLAMTPAFQRRALVALDALYLTGFGPRLPQAVVELHQAARKVTS